MARKTAQERLEKYNEKQAAKQWERDEIAANAKMVAEVVAEVQEKKAAVRKAALKAAMMPMIRATDAYAENAGAKIKFKHVPSGRTVGFKAFITAFNETYSSDWANEVVYGRVDPIYLFKNTTRKISLAFKIPAADIAEAKSNLAAVQELIQCLYPNYTTLRDPHGTQAAQTISQSPMMRIQVMNLLQTGASGSPMENLYQSETGRMPWEHGQLGVINSLTVNHNLEGPDGVLHDGIGKVYSKLIDVNIDFSPIHEHPIGWSKNGMTVQPMRPDFPYNAGGRRKRGGLGSNLKFARESQQGRIDNIGNLAPDATDGAAEATTRRARRLQNQAAREEKKASIKSFMENSDMTRKEARQAVEILSEPGSRG